MNWRRVIIFAMLLYVANWVAGFSFGILRAYFRHASGNIPDWMLPLALSGAVVPVAIALGYLQRKRLVRHALAAVLGTYVISFQIDGLPKGQPFVIGLIGVLFFVLLVAVGAAVGLLLRKLGEHRDAHRLGSAAQQRAVARGEALVEIRRVRTTRARR